MTQFPTDIQVDVVIPTRDRGRLIDATVASIRASDHRNFRLWIVDQSDNDLTRQAVAPHAAADHRIQYVKSRTRGSNVGRHLGLLAGDAPYVLFTDDDCRVEPDWIGRLAVELRDGASAVFGRIVPDETFQPTIAANDIPVSRALPMALMDVAERRVFEGSRLNLGFGHGANMGVRRATYLDAGGFDTLLGSGAVFRSWPERDLGYRLLSRGGRIIYTPAALVYHRHWRGWREVRRTYRNYGFGAGAAAAKYLRCGDRGGLYLLAEWLLDQGVRQVASGILKWRSWQKIQVGLLQLLYPWIGIVRSLRYPLDKEHMIYLPQDQ